MNNQNALQINSLTRALYFAFVSLVGLICLAAALEEYGYQNSSRDNAAREELTLTHQQLTRSAFSGQSFRQHGPIGTQMLIQNSLAGVVSLDPEIEAMTFVYEDGQGRQFEIGQRPSDIAGYRVIESYFDESKTLQYLPGSQSTLTAYFKRESVFAALLHAFPYLVGLMLLVLICLPFPDRTGGQDPLAGRLFPALRTSPPVVQTITIGVVLTLVMTVWAFHFEKRRFERSTWTSATSSLRLLQDSLWEFEHLYAASATAFFAASETVTNDEFARFFNWLDNVEAIEWVGIVNAVSSPDGAVRWSVKYFHGTDGARDELNQALRQDAGLRTVLQQRDHAAPLSQCPIFLPESILGSVIVQELELHDPEMEDALLIGFSLQDLLRAACVKSGAMESPFRYTTSIWAAGPDGQPLYLASCRDGEAASLPEGLTFTVTTHHGAYLFTFKSMSANPLIGASYLWILFLLTGAALTTLAGLMVRSIIRRQHQIEALASERSQLLDRQEHLMASIFDSIVECVISTNPDNQIIFFNQAAVEMTGLTAEEAIGSRIEDILSSLHDEDSNSGFNFALAQEELPKRIQKTVFISRDGRVLNVAGFVSGIQEVDGSACGKVFVLRDDTASTLKLRSTSALVGLYAQTERTSEEEFLRKGLDIIEEALHSRISFLHLVSENQQDLELTAWSSATLETYCQASFERHYPVAKAGIWADCVRTRSPMIINDYEAHPWKLGLPEGHAALTRLISLPVIEHERVRMIIGLGNAEFPYNSTDLSILDSFAREIYVLLIRFRHSRAMRLQQAETQRLALATEESPASIVITSIDGTIEYVNRRFEQVSGYGREEVIGCNPRILRSPENTTTDYREMWKVLLAGEVWEGEFHNQRKDGTQYWEWAKIAPIKDEHGQVISFLAVKEDITERRANEARLQEMNDHLMRMAQQAKAASEAKSRFIANMSHEIRTPMNGIIGMSQLLAETHLDDEQKGYLRTVVECSNNLLQTINEILDMSKIEKGGVDIKSGPFSLKVFFETIRSSFDAQVRIKGLELEHQIDASIPDRLMGDPFHLRQVVTNLVNNAYKFTDEGSIRIHARFLRMEGHNVRFCIDVMDTGIGIAKDKQQVVFENFSQVDNSSTRKYDGVGLGLAISRRLVELMGGRITLVSELGMGSTFTVELSLPVDESTADKDSSNGSLSKSGAEVGGNQALRRALVVDDNATNLRTMSFLLRKFGVDSTTCISGKDALTAFSEGDYDFILLDILMPDMDGVAALGLIRETAQKRNVRVPVVANTAKAMVGDREGLLEVGFDDYLEKPVTLQSLGRLLDRLFD